ncbi:MAG: glycerol-3-phosphate 1-O-acyltransferase PlsY [Pyrinomonadaceae bacterium]
MRHASILIVAYLLGSIPFGYLIVRLTQKADVRETGSGGTGATNVTRRAGKFAGVLTLVLDALKGAAAVGLARWLTTPDLSADWWIAAAAFAAIAGHVFPVWLNFRGGKGVATGLGIFICLAPVAMLATLPIFACVVWATRYVSLGSIIAVIALPVCISLLGAYAKPLIDLKPLLTAVIACGALIVWMHRANIQRLLRGTENKLR